MKLSSLGLIITDDCNFDCIYCYKARSKNSMEYSTVHRFLTFFLPKLKKKYYINFSGGEPLLHFNLIKKTVSFLDSENKKSKKKNGYSITTNGSLITEEVIQFFDKHRFSVELSFDGLAQKVSREKQSYEKIVSNIKELMNQPHIDLEINSVFTPETVDYFSESIQSHMALGVPNIRFCLSILEPWSQASLRAYEKESTKLREILLTHYKRTGQLPVINFREDQAKGIFYCSAGKDRLIITPDEKIWGCFLIPEYFHGRESSVDYEKYFFGTLDDFIENHRTLYPQISSNYARLSMDHFSTSKMECFLCPELEDCAVCPINASFCGSPLEKIPDYACEIQKMEIREKKLFRKDLKLLSEKT